MTTFQLPGGSSGLHDRKIEMTADSEDGMKHLPETLSRKPFFYLMVAPPGSGKTNLIVNMLTNKKLYGKRFEIVHFFSPSMSTIKIPLPKQNLHDELDLTVVDKVAKDLRKGERALFVFDDMVNDIQKGKTLKPFLKLAYNRRHLGGAGVSMMLTTQKLTRVDLTLRAAVSGVFFWRTSNKKEIKSFYDEFVNLDWPVFMKMLEFVWDKPHDFLYLRLDVDESKRYHKNFDLLKIV